jgi:phosphate transport system ATP-binding protein
MDEKSFSEQLEMNTQRTKIEVDKLSVHYGAVSALSDLSLKIRSHFVTALIGPSGCGKSTFLRCLNRMNDIIPGVEIEGTILLDGEDIYSEEVDVVQLRCRVGMVFQKSNPFPKTVFENVAYGLRVNGWKDRYSIERRVVRSLQSAALWNEVKDRLHKPALTLSGGQQQRLCIARALAIEPEVLLMDEPAGALDPIATARIEDLIRELKQKYTIVIVTHNLQQAARISDQAAFVYMGRLIEFNRTQLIFTSPERQETEDYVTGRFD